ncbi:MAG: hypothetical protein LBR88_03215 [Zoogloeaceae bacterium]|jgi:hypothetical protein|nr:hypothetical protein [Zoogloeaceae bacterium]
MLWTLLFFGCVGIALALTGLLWALEQKPPRLVDAMGAEPVSSDKTVTHP